MAVSAFRIGEDRNMTATARTNLRKEQRQPFGAGEDRNRPIVTMLRDGPLAASVLRDWRGSQQRDPGVRERVALASASC